VVFFRTPAGRSQPLEFLDGLPKKDRAAILEDLWRVAERGREAPASVKPIKGGGARGLLEVRTKGFRSFWCVYRGELCVLHVCRKGDQPAGIVAARSRMATLEEDP
jgi:hypothetical protein